MLMVNIKVEDDSKIKTLREGNCSSAVNFDEVKIEFFEESTNAVENYERKTFFEDKSSLEHSELLKVESIEKVCSSGRENKKEKGEDNLSLEYLDDVKLEFTDEMSNNESNVELNNSFECQECGKCLSSKSKLKIHQKTVHDGIKSFECQECGKLERKVS